MNLAKEAKRMIVIKDGKIIGARGIVVDLTESKATERQLKDNERLAAIGATAGMVGHDIRNPLQAIVSELYLAKETMASAPDGIGKKEAIDSLNFVQEKVDYISKIVGDLQDYARKTNPIIKDVNIKDFIRKTFSAISIPSSVVAEYKLEGNPQLKTDPDFLRRIITNLSTNAIQAMPTGGKLMLKVKENNGFVEISVSDTGTGIPKEIQEKIFTPLFTTKSKGQGFGLAVVKKFVEQLGGTITFESQEGKGTKFTIELPLKSLS
jgi:signal transduction histidine kinase